MCGIILCRTLKILMTLYYDAEYSWPPSCTMSLSYGFLQKFLGRCGHRPLRIVRFLHIIVGCDAHIAPWKVWWILLLLQNIRGQPLEWGGTTKSWRREFNLDEIFTPSVSFADSSPGGGAHYHFRWQRLAAARSRSGSERPPDVHSLPSRRFATLQEHLYRISADLGSMFHRTLRKGGLITQGGILFLVLHKINRGSKKNLKKRKATQAVRP